MANLGAMFEDEVDVRRDLAEARRWYGQAAERGDTEAKKALDRLFKR